MLYLCCVTFLQCGRKVTKRTHLRAGVSIPPPLRIPPLKRPRANQWFPLDPLLAQPDVGLKNKRWWIIGTALSIECSVYVHRIQSLEHHIGEYPTEGAAAPSWVVLRVRIFNGEQVSKADLTVTASPQGEAFWATTGGATTVLCVSALRNKMGIPPLFTQCSE